MKTKLINAAVEFLKKYNNYSTKEMQKLRYGLEGIYLTFTKTVIILLISMLLNIFWEVIICLLFFNVIRYFAFGFHAEKSFECLVLSIFNFIFIPYVLLNINISINTKLIICAVCLILILLFAPADTIKRPLKNKRKRIIRKILTFITAIGYTLLIYFFNNSFISKIILASLIVTAIVINPITYMIFKQPYNNYKKL